MANGIVRLEKREQHGTGSIIFINYSSKKITNRYIYYNLYLNLSITNKHQRDNVCIKVKITTDNCINIQTKKQYSIYEFAVESHKQSLQ